MTSDSSPGYVKELGMSDDNVTPDNPAGRIHAILELMKNTKAPSVLAAFASVFSTNKDDFAGIYRCLGEVAITVDEVADRLRQSDNEAFEKVYNKTIPRIKNAFIVTHFDQQWEQFKQGHVFEDDLRALEFCSAALSRDCPEPVLTEDQLKSLLARVDELYKEVWSLELEGDLKASILDGLQAIRTAIHDYKIRGSRGLDEAVKGVLVTAVASHEVQANEKGVMDKFRQFVADAAKLIQLGKLLQPLYENVIKLLPPHT
jgi:hypothetical protein